VEGVNEARFAEWAFGSATTGMAAVHHGAVEATNARFDKFAEGEGAWRWLSGPHASTTYDGLRTLVLEEAALPRHGTTVSRFERSGSVIELRFERLTGPTAGTMVVIHDVTTELRRVTAQQREREGLLHDERMQAMGVLGSSVAHDLNHALNVIALRVATLRKEPALDKFGRTLDSLARMVGDAAGIVARLQDLARSRRDRPTEAVDLSAVLTGAIEMARTEADPLGVRIEARVPPLPLVRGSAAELSHVFMSLLARARAEMPRGGTVHVRARDDGRQVVVSLQDEGRGLREHELARLFDPFAGGRRDLGLSIAYGVMARLGGSIAAGSEPPGAPAGTTFTLSFPHAQATKRVEAPAPPPHPHRVLLVDDEADNLEVLSEVLQMEGQHVTTSQSGPLALARLRRGESFDLVLCDVGMPEMSGWQVAREIQLLSPGTRVYMLTGWANEIGATDVRRRLVRGVLAKPLDLHALKMLLSVPRADADEAASVAH
jgi:two-component system cell cycle sensor histidine kinase/response regulator CckA